MENKPNITLNINLYGITIGHLTYDINKRRYSFAFTEEYFRSPYDISPILAPKKDFKPEQPFETDSRTGAPYFLADGYNPRRFNSAFEAWCKKHEIDKNNPERLAAQLLFTGTYGPGALEYRLKNGPDSYRELVEVSSRLHEKIENMHLACNGRYLLDILSSLGLFLGGLTRKAAIAIEEDGTIRAEKENDTTGQYILKRQFIQKGGIVAEITGNRTAQKAGIIIPEYREFTVDGKTGLLFKRYDRNNGQKIHTASLNSIDYRVQSYEGVMNIMIKMGISNEDIGQMYRRIIYNVFMNITDCHGGNVTFLMGRDGRWTLAPAYDIFPTLLDNIPHHLSINEKKEGITESDLINFGKKYDIPDTEKTVREIKEISEPAMKTLQNTETETNG